MKPPYPTIESLAAMIRIEDPKAIRYVVAELKRSGGNIQATSRAIGCSERTLYKWRDASPALAAAFAQHAMGRAGAAARARGHK